MSEEHAAQFFKCHFLFHCFCKRRHSGNITDQNHSAESVIEEVILLVLLFAAISVERAVIVDAQMKTNIEDIYACGDCAQYEGVNYAIWPQAVEEGKVAGANAAGEELTYTTVPAALTFHGMNTALYAIGDTGKNPSLIDRKSVV